MVLRINKDKKFPPCRFLSLKKRKILHSSSAVLSNNGLNSNVTELINGLLSQKQNRLTKEQRFGRKLELMFFNYVNRVNSLLEYFFTKKDPDLEPFKTKERMLKKGNGGDGCSIASTLNLLRLCSDLIEPEYKDVLKDFNKAFSMAITILKTDSKHGKEFKTLSQKPPVIIDIDNVSTVLAPSILLKYFFNNKYAEHYVVQSFKNLFSSQLEGSVFSPLGAYRLLKDLENGLPAVALFINTSNYTSGHAVTLLGVVKGSHYKTFLNLLKNSCDKQKDYWVNRSLFCLDLIQEGIKNPGFFVYYDQNAMKLFKVKILDLLFNTVEFEAVVPNSQFIGQSNTRALTETVEENLAETKLAT